MPRLRQVELAELLAIGAGECAGLVAEQLAFQQLVRDGRAVHFHERLVAAPRLPVNHARDNFLAGAALAADQHRGRGVGHLLDGVLHLLHAGAGAEQRGEVAVAPHLVAKLRHLAGGTLLLQNSGDAQFQVARVERLDEVVVGPQLGGVKDDVGVVARGEHQHGGIGLGPLDAAEYVECGHAGQREIQQDEGGIEAGEHAQGLVAAGGATHLEAAPRHLGGNHSPHGEIVVHHEHA